MCSHGYVCFRYFIAAQFVDSVHIFQLWLTFGNYNYIIKIFCLARSAYSWCLWWTAEWKKIRSPVEFLQIIPFADRIQSNWFNCSERMKITCVRVTFIILFNRLFFIKYSQFSLSLGVWDDFNDYNGKWNENYTVRYLWSNTFWSDCTNDTQYMCMYEMCGREREKIAIRCYCWQFCFHCCCYWCCRFIGE